MGGALKSVDYWVERGTDRALGCNEIVSSRLEVHDRPHIAPDQCVVQPAEDGSEIYVYARGTYPTGWRTSPQQEWTWMQPGESVALGTGHKISLDYYDPGACVFKFEKNDPSEAPGPARSCLTFMPPGWVSGIDEASGQTYYMNQQTGQSQWEPPR